MNNKHCKTNYLQQQAMRVLNETKMGEKGGSLIK